MFKKLSESVERYEKNAVFLKEVADALFVKLRKQYEMMQSSSSLSA